MLPLMQLQSHANVMLVASCKKKHLTASDSCKQAYMLLYSDN